MPDELRLHLLRHADAGDPDAWEGPDDARPLSPKGHRQAERLAALLVGAGFATDAIITSPLVRARQTAEHLAEAVGRPVVVDARVHGPLDPITVDRILADHGNPARPVLVGHDPEFSALLGELVGAEGLAMKKGALARVDAERPLSAGAGVLRWLVPPDLLRS